MKLVGEEACADIFINSNIIVRPYSRCCSEHFLNQKYLKKESIRNISVYSNKTKLNNNQINNLIQSFSKRDTDFKDIFSRFKNINNIDADFSFQITGFTLEELQFILLQLKSLNNSPERTKCQALAIYLFWLKTALSQNTIAIIFGSIDRNKVQHYCQQVREALEKSFIPKYLGVSHLTRNEWIGHNTETVVELFDLKADQFAAHADSTYLYCEKSSNNSFQRKTYSGQKKRHLIKPFVMCTADGYIIDVFGPYQATHNDATILLDLMKNSQNINNLFKPKDLIVLDRGFRDAVQDLKKNYDLIIKIPTCLPSSRKTSQLNTIESNRSRCVPFIPIN